MDAPGPSRENFTWLLGYPIRAIFLQMLIAFRLQEAGIDISEMPNGSIERIMWIIGRLCDGLTSYRIFVIQREINSRYPEYYVNVVDLVSSWVGKDLSDILTWTGNGGTLLDRMELDFEMSYNPDLYDHDFSDDSDMSDGPDMWHDPQRGL